MIQPRELADKAGAFAPGDVPPAESNEHRDRDVIGMQQWANRAAIFDHGRRPLDLAEGIVMTLLGCDTSTAFAELVAVATERSVPVLTLAGALVDLVADHRDARLDSPAHQAARSRWGPMLAQRTHVHGASA